MARLSSAPLGEYYGELHLAPSGGGWGSRILSSSDTLGTIVSEDGTGDLISGFELVSLEPLTDSVLQVLFVPEVLIKSSPTTVLTFTVQYATAGGDRVDLIADVFSYYEYESEVSVVASVRLSNGSSLENLAPSGTVEIDLELSSAIKPEYGYDMFLGVARTGTGGSDVLAEEYSYFYVDASDYIVIDFIEREVLKSRPTVFTMGVYYKSSQPLTSVDIIVVVKSVSDPSAPSIVFSVEGVEVLSWLPCPNCSSTR